MRNVSIILRWNSSAIGLNKYEHCIRECIMLYNSCVFNTKWPSAQYELHESNTLSESKTFRECNMHVQGNVTASHTSGKLRPVFFIWYMYYQTLRTNYTPTSKVDGVSELLGMNVALYNLFFSDMTTKETTYRMYANRKWQLSSLKSQVWPDTGLIQSNTVCCPTKEKRIQQNTGCHPA